MKREIADIVSRALEEDLKDVGDITSNSVIPADARSNAHLVAREDGVIAGLEVAELVFERVDPEIEVRRTGVSNGDHVTAGTVILEIEGPARSVLTAERTALNLLARMSGVATATARLVEAVEGTGTRITDTRKTMPGLRVLDKYAVTAGGGVNHRMGLYDAVMIKDNHIAAAGDIARAVQQARESVGPEVRVIVEVEDLDQLAVALQTDADRVLLDNMDLGTLSRAVEMVDGVMETEASGGITIQNVRSVAETGVDVISVGAITHSVPQLDLALDFV